MCTSMNQRVLFATMLILGLGGWAAFAEGGPADRPTSRDELSKVAFADPPPCPPYDPNGTPGARLKSKVCEFVQEECETAKLLAQDDLGIFTTLQKDRMGAACEDGRQWVELTEEAEFQAIGTLRNATAFMEYAGPDCTDDTNPCPICDPNNSAYDIDACPNGSLGNDYWAYGDMDGVCKPKGRGPAPLVGAGDLSRILAADDKPLPKFHEWCAEVIGDGIGDDDGFCEKKKLDEPVPGEGRWYTEPCVVLTGAEVLDSQPENFDDEKVNIVVGFFDDATKALKLGNAKLVRGMETLRSLKATAARLADGGDASVCENMLALPSGPESKDFDLLYGLLIAGQVADDIHAACDSGCNQDILGNNCAAVCLALAIVRGALVSAYEVEQFLDDAVSSVYVENTVKCLEYHHDFMKDQLKAVQNSLDFIVEWRRLHLQIVELKEKREFLVGVTEAGRPAHVEESTVRVSERDPLSFTDIESTWTPVADGIYHVLIDLSVHQQNAQLFVFTASHTEDYLDADLNTQSVEHSGFVLFDRSPQNTITTGQ